MALSDQMRQLTRHFVEAYDDRAAAVADIHTSTAQELAESHNAHQAMAAEQRQCLTEYAATLKSGTATMLGDFRTTHQAMAEEQYQRLTAERAGLTSDVAAMRGTLAAMRGTLQVDLSEARQAWSSFAGQMQERRAGMPVAAPPPPPSPTEEVANDDLTAIRGIGSGTQRHLNEAGIFTYAQLAESTPEELRQVLGEGPQATKAWEWIEQAQGLVE
jgi:predicted flap endonuclease-1-like 5' DNA nuclease